MSTSVTSIRELRRRLREVYDASSHLKARLPVDSPHNALLTINDIAVFTAQHCGWLRQQRLSTPPDKCQAGCRIVEECRATPTCRRMDACLQVKLSAFFQGWDDGSLLKARVGDTWCVCAREHLNPALAKMAAAQRAQVEVNPSRVLNMKIDMGSGVPRLRGR